MGKHAINQEKRNAVAVDRRHQSAPNGATKGKHLNWYTSVYTSGVLQGILLN